MISGVVKLRAKTSDGGTAAAIEWTFRVLFLAVLAAGYLGLCSLLFPMKAEMPDLLQDIRNGDTSVVRVVSYDVGEVHVYWSAGYLRDYQFTHRYKSAFTPDGSTSPEERFTTDVRKTLGEQAGKLTFAEGDRLDPLGVVDLLVPVLYWRIMPFFAWPVAVCCIVALTGMILRPDLRSPSAGYWLVASLVFGFGFAAYYWSEPRPLWTRRENASKGRQVLTGRQVAGATACWAVLGGVAAVTMALARR